MHSLVKCTRYLQDVQVLSFDAHIARCPFHTVVTPVDIYNWFPFYFKMKKTKVYLKKVRWI